MRLHWDFAIGISNSRGRETSLCNDSYSLPIACSLITTRWYCISISIESTDRTLNITSAISLTRYQIFHVVLEPIVGVANVFDCSATEFDDVVTRVDSQCGREVRVQRTTVAPHSQFRTNISFIQRSRRFIGSSVWSSLGRICRCS